jgi:glutathione synthase/RimK-type ligase-like ATP-grasp enzyme
MIDVGLVTSADMVPVSDDDMLLSEALEAEGLSVEALLWNRPHVVRWNSDKSYLRDLQERGVPTIQTVWLRQGDPAELAGIMTDNAWDDAVVKPSVSLDAFGTMRVSRERVEEGQRHLERMLEERDMMVQPYLSAVEGYGERSLMYIDGEFSHAVRRSPALSRKEGEGVTPVEASPEETMLAAKVLHATGYNTLYVRVDLVHDNEGTLRLMELELVEPSLFFTHSPQAVSRMVAAIMERLAVLR